MARRSHGWRRAVDELAETLQECGQAVLLLFTPWNWGHRSLGRRLLEGLLDGAGAVLILLTPWNWQWLRDRFRRERTPDDAAVREMLARQRLAGRRRLGAVALAAVPVVLLVGSLVGAGGRMDRRLASAAETAGAPRAPGAPAAGTQDPADLARLREQVARRPGDAALRASLAAELLRNGLLAEAAREYDAVLGMDGESSTGLLGLSQVALKMEDAGALPLAEQAAKARPKDPEALHALAVAQARAGQAAEAARTFERALALSPRDWNLLLNAAACYAELKEWQKAEECCERAIRLADNESVPRLLLADIRLRQNRRADWAGEMDRAAAAAPDDAEVQLLAGRARLARGNAAEALKLLQRAQELRPGWPAPCIDAGVAYLELKQPARAREQFEKGLHNTPEGPERIAVRMAIGQTYEVEGRTADAMRIYEQVVALAPDHPQALNNLAYRYAHAGRDLGRARELAERAASLQPDNPSVLDTLGWICYLAGRHADAVRHLEKAAGRAEKNPVIRYHLGRALLALGRRQDAARELQLALAGPLPAAEAAEARAALDTAARAN